MLRSQELYQNILDLKAEIKTGIDSNLDMKDKAAELDSLLSGYQDALEKENSKKNKENTQTMDRKSVNLAIKNLLQGRPAGVEGFVPTVVDAAGNYNGSPESAGAYLVGEEFLPLEKLNGGDVDLSQFCRTINVSKPTGKIPTYDRSKKIELANFVSDNATEIAQKALAFDQVPYAIQPRGAVIPVSLDLIQDANEDVLGLVYEAFGDGKVYSKNKDIFKELAKGTATIEGVDLTTHALVDAIKRAINKEIPTRYAHNAVIICNQTVFNNLATLKDAQKQYVLQPIVTEKDAYAIDGHRVVVMDDDYTELANTVYVADMNVILNITRQGLELATDASSGFKTYSLNVRAVERFQELGINPAAICKITAA